MGQLVKSVRKNQVQINRAVWQLQANVDAQGLEGYFADYFREQESKFKNIQNIPYLVTGSFFLSGLSIIKNDLDFFVNYFKREEKAPLELEATKRALNLCLLATKTLLVHAIEYVEGQGENREAELLAKILEVQEKTQGVLNTLFPEEEKILGPDLTNLRTEYEESYAVKYGSGCLGFFKLPIKRFFRQDSRSEELQFIEDVNNYLQGEGQHLAKTDQETMRLSALNLVRFKIESEPFGKGSQLHRIINDRLTQGGFQGNTDMSDGFISDCDTLNIKVPDILRSFDERYSVNSTSTGL